MPPHVKPPPFWQTVDLSETCRNWRTGSSGEIPMSAFADALVILRNALNFLFANMPILRFCRAHVHPEWRGGGGVATTSSAPADGGDAHPFHLWKVPDRHNNRDAKTFRMVSWFRKLDPDAPSVSSAYAQRTDNSHNVDATALTAKYSGSATNLTTNSYFYDEIIDGNAPDGDEQEGIATFKDYVIGSIVVQDVPKTSLNTAVDSSCPMVPARGDPILGGQVIERLANQFNTFRQQNRPMVFCWGSYTTSGSYDTGIASNTGGPTGVCVTDTANFRNVLKPSQSSAAPAFASSTIGPQAHVQYCGLGDQTNIADDRRLRVEFWVLGKAITSNATFRILGPDGTFSAGTSADITVTTSLGWFGGASAYIYLDTSQAYNVSSSNMPKVEWWLKAGHANGVNVYTVIGLAQYGY